MTQTFSSMNTVTDSYGFKFFVGGNRDGSSGASDPMCLPIDSSGRIALIVWCNPPYATVYFKTYIDGVLIDEGYGSGHNNVVDRSVPIHASDFSYESQPIYQYSSVVGEHQITATAVVNNNPPIEATATLYITNPALNTPQQSEAEQDLEQTIIEQPSTPTIAPKQMVTVTFKNAPENVVAQLYNSQNQLIVLTQTTPNSEGRYIRTEPPSGTYTAVAQSETYQACQEITVVAGSNIEMFVTVQGTALSTPTPSASTTPAPTTTNSQDVTPPTSEPPTNNVSTPWWQPLMDFFTFNWLRDLLHI